MKQPKYILAEQDGRDVVIRTRKPPCLALIKQTGVTTGSIEDLVTVLPIDARDPKLRDSILRWYHHAKGWPYGYAA